MVGVGDWKEKHKLGLIVNGHICDAEESDPCPMGT